MRVYVYRNLHKKCLSVRDVKTRLVVAHVDSISLENCKFKVSASLRQRVLKEKRKNVHAGVEGDWVKDSVAPDISKCRRIMYDPYKYESFVDEGSMAPFFESKTAFVTIRGAFIK